MSRMRVAVADDDSYVLELSLLILRSAGYDAEGAPDGESLIDLCLRWPPDLVVCDLIMPGINGFETCEALLQVRPTPVVLMSGAWSDKRAEEAERIGASFLQKPFGPGDMAAALAWATARMGTRPTAADPFLGRRTGGRGEVDLTSGGMGSSNRGS